MHGHTRGVLLSVAMSTPKKPEDPPSNSCGIFILGLIVYTVLFFLCFPQYCILFVPGMDQKDAALGIYMLGIVAYPSILPFWMVLWHIGFKWCFRPPAVPPTKPE